MSSLRRFSFFVLQSNYMSSLRRFFLVFDCFGYFRLFSINSFLISNRGTTAGEQTPFIVLCMYVTLRTTKFTHSDDT